MANISHKWLGECSLLVPFTREYSRELHASKIAQILSLPQKTVARKLGRLETVYLLQYRREGKNKYYSLNLKNSFILSLLQIVEAYKEIQFKLRHPELGVLLGELSWQASVILFGSYAKGLATKDSDIDLVIFSQKNKKILDILGRSPFPVNVHYVTTSLLGKKLKEQQHLAKEIAHDHILFGEKEKVIKVFINHWRP